MSKSAYTLAFSRFSKQENAAIQRAVDMACAAHKGQKRSDGTPYITHPIAVAEILEEWGADLETILAGILHDTLEDTSLRFTDIVDEFGVPVAELIEGVTKFTNADFEGIDHMDRKIETIRKLFEVMRRDIRVVIIKLADRLHNIRTIHLLPRERQIRFAKETVDVYHKLAYHLGMNELLREFSNTCVPILYPAYMKDCDMHIERDKEKYPAFELLQSKLQASSFSHMLSKIFLIRSAYRLPKDVEKKSRPPSFYLVCVVKNVDDCYALLQNVHSLFSPVPGKFYDYIAASPDTGYKSIHTTVVGPNGVHMQLRIRTEEMQSQSQKGVLHYIYNAKKGDTVLPSWIERSAQLDTSTRESSNAFWDALQSDIFRKNNQVTVQSIPIAVPVGATALDASFIALKEDAYRISQIQVNGVVVPYAYVLSRDDVIELDCTEQSNVQPEWLDSTQTKFAQTIIIADLEKRNREEMIELGERLLQKESDHFQLGLLSHVSKQQVQRLLKEFSQDSLDDIFALIGEGTLPPRSVLFVVFPQKSVSAKDAKPVRYRLRCRVLYSQKNEALSQIASIAKLHHVFLHKIQVGNVFKKRVELKIQITAKQVADYANFLGVLHRHTEYSNIRTLLSWKHTMLLASYCIAAFLVLLGNVLALPYYSQWFVQQTRFSGFLVLGAIAFPVFLMNAYVLRLFRQYMVGMRNDVFFLVIGFLLNVACFIIIVFQGFLLPNFHLTLYPLVVLFAAMMMYNGYVFFETESLMQKVHRSVHVPTDSEWSNIVHTKIVGYTLRFFAVILWGILPLVLKYTPANTVDPFARIAFIGIGVLIVVALCWGIAHFVLKPVVPRQKLKKDILLASIVVSHIFFMYFISASLQRTSGTNFILFNNFSPVFALMLAAIFWRNSIPYLKQPRHIFWIFLTFLFGSMGGALIIYNTVSSGTQISLKGDTMGLIAMVADTALVVSQIRYMTLHKHVSSLQVIAFVFFCHILATLPLLGFLYWANSPIVSSITTSALLWSIGVGCMLGIGQILNYETFRRIDGFIAFLMFNISILITFIVEVFVFKTFVPGWHLLLGGAIIISSTIIAELINSHCQRKGL